MSHVGLCRVLKSATGCPVARIRIPKNIMQKEMCEKFGKSPINVGARIVSQTKHNRRNCRYFFEIGDGFPCSRTREWQHVLHEPTEIPYYSDVKVVDLVRFMDTSNGIEF